MHRFIVLLFFVAALFGLPGPLAAADSADCMSKYYVQSKPSCVDAIVAMLSKGGDNQPGQSRASSPTAVGFFAGVFSTSKQEKERILSKDVPTNIKAMYVEALYRAGSSDEAGQLADSLKLGELIQRHRTVYVPILKVVTPYNDPGDNDLLIGAYMATGNIELIQKILSNYLGIDSALASDAFRISLMLGKFGRSLGPPERQSVTMATACQRYGCKSNPAKMLRLLTLASAFWALTSLSRSDDGVKKAVGAFIDQDPSLKATLEVEQTALGNYLTMLIAFAAIKNDARINKALSIYEGLGPVAAMNDAWIKK